MHVSHLLLLLHQLAATSSCLLWLDKYWLENERLDVQISEQPRNMRSFYCLSQERRYLPGDTEPTAKKHRLLRTLKHFQRRRVDEGKKGLKVISGLQWIHTLAAQL